MSCIMYCAWTFFSTVLSKMQNTQIDIFFQRIVLRYVLMGIKYCWSTNQH